MKRVPPSVRTQEALDRLLMDLGSDNPITQLVRLGAQRIVEEALEGKTRDILGRGYYEHGAEGRGYRNGYRQGRLKTAEGEVRFAVPQLRDADNGELAALRQSLGGRSEALVDLAIEMYARGCSTRDIERVFSDDTGRSLLSRSAVSELTAAIWDEYEAFATRDLSDIRPLYLFLDGIAERLMPGCRREAVLCAWAITWSGKKVLLHVAPGTKESTECVKDFLQDMLRRGLDTPVLTVSDGAPGLIRAVEECLPGSLRQRCLAHRMRNLMNKLPESIQAEIREAARAAYQAPSPAMARALRDDLVSRYEADYPSAVRCFADDFEACIAHLQCPPEHRRMIRTTNLLERLFGEERRRTKVTPTIAGERPVLKLMYAALIRGAERWRGIKVGELQRQQLRRLRQQLDQQHREANAPAVKSKTGSTAEENLQQF